MEIHLPRRSINEVIQNFQSQKDKLSQEKKLLDVEFVDALERTISEEFDKILDYSPISTLESVVLVDFLLIALNELHIGSILPDQINAKILEIVASEYMRHPANQN